MKRAPLILTVGFVGLLAGSFFIYHYFLSPKSVSVWDLIPEQTVLVYEVGDCNTCKPQSTVPGEVFSSLLYHFTGEEKEKLKDVLSFLSSPQSGEYISLHVTRKDDFDLVYYFQSDRIKIFETALNNVEIKDKRFTDRELNGVTIREVRVGKQLFSWAKLEGIWVGSFTPFLVEDVIRTFTQGKSSGFRDDIAEVYALPRIKNDPGNIYLHLKNFQHYLTTFLQDEFELPELGQATLLDIKNGENTIVLNGFSLTRNTTNQSTLGYFENQSPVQFGLKQYISNRTVFARAYGISDGNSFFQNLNLSKNKRIQDSLKNVSGIDFPTLYASFGDELAVCYTESSGKDFSKVILFESEKPEAWLNTFDKLSKAVEKDDTVFYEKYSTYEIREIESRDIPGKFFNPLIDGFSQTYYTSIGNIIILAEQLEEIKQFVDDIDREEVWGKSVAFNKFLETTLLESNISMYVNTPLVWSGLISKINPRWKTFVADNQSLLKAIGLGAVQFSHLNESFYTNVIWTFSSHTDNQTKRSEQLVASLGSAIIGKPFVVKSHIDRSNEVLVQDSTFTLYHLSGNGKVLWRKSLEGPIIGEVKQIDYYKNGKLQFFLSTPSKIHVIDRLGNYVSPFPADARTKNVEFVSVVDYDNSKRYRFLLIDKSGKLWMYDKEFQNLDGWRPKNIESELFTTAQHHRIRGKDYVLAIRKDGWAYLMNRRGENLKGFPLNLDARPDGSYFVKLGNSLAETHFVCVSRDGFRVKFNLEGKILSRETLVKPSFETQFSLIPEQNNKSYLIKRQDSKRLVLLDEEGKEIVLNEFVGMNAVDVRYYDFGAGRIYISITDQAQELSYIYDGNGKLLTTPPLVGKALVLRVGEGDFPKIYLADSNTLIIQ